MFGFGRKPKQMTEEQYRAEYRRLRNELFDQFSIGDSPQEEVLYAINAIETEMNRNGGVNWNEADFTEDMDILAEHLTTEPTFSEEQVDRIHWALDELAACGQELKEQGLSRRNVSGPIDLLIFRVVDWCRLHPREEAKE